jgi:hypothetical protein
MNSATTITASLWRRCGVADAVWRFDFTASLASLIYLSNKGKEETGTLRARQ